MENIEQDNINNVRDITLNTQQIDNNHITDIMHEGSICQDIKIMLYV